MKILNIRKDLMSWCLHKTFTYINESDQGMPRTVHKVKYKQFEVNDLKHAIPLIRPCKEMCAVYR